MLVMTSFCSVEDTEIFKKQNKTKVTRFVQDISFVCPSPAMGRAWTRGVTSKCGGFLVNWGRLW